MADVEDVFLPIFMSLIAGLSTTIGGSVVFFVSEPSPRAMAFTLVRSQLVRDSFENHLETRCVIVVSRGHPPASLLTVPCGIPRPPLPNRH